MLEPKQIEETGRQLVKAANEGDPAATVLTLLEGLKGWTASEKLLRQTKIGIAVNKLRQFKDAKVQSEATRLINKWKTDVKGADKKGNGTASPAAKAVAANGRSATSSPAPGASVKAEPVKKEPVKAARPKVDPEKRSDKTDGVDTSVTGNATRDSCVKLMYNGLAFMSEEAPEDLLTVARNVELAAFNEFQPETSNGYKTKMRSLFQNLKLKPNTALRRNVTSGAIEPKRFGEFRTSHVHILISGR